MSTEADTETPQEDEAASSNKIKSLKDLVQKLNRGPSEVVSLDIGTTGIKAVRMRKTGDGAHVTGVGLLPPVELSNESGRKNGDPPDPEPLQLPPHLKARHATLTISAEDAIIKLLSLPGRFTDTTESQIISSMGVEDESTYRVGYKVISEGRGRSESVVLAVALPNMSATYPLRLLPAGLPAPYSIEVAGLAAMSAFLHGPAMDLGEETIGAIDFGARVSFFAIFEKSRLVLIRKFNFGTEPVLEKIQALLCVDRETAQGVLSDGSFDLAQPIAEIMESFVKQLVISRDFVERRYNCSLSGLYASGGAVGSRDWLTELENAFGLEITPWNPFTGVSIEKTVDMAAIAGQESRFAAAVGAGLATFEDT